MKRILRIINRFNLGGPTFNAAYLTKYLYPEYETLLIGGIHEESEESSEFILNSLGIKALVIPEMRRSINGIADFQAYQKIKKIIKDFNPHIVHTHASKAGILGRKAAFEMNVPVVFHTFHGNVFHSYFNAFKTLAFIKIERQLAKKTDKIIAISPLQKDELVNVYKIANSQKVEIVPLGLDMRRFVENQNEKRYIFRKENQLDDDEIAIVIVGRLAPIKNHQLFVKAISKAKQICQKKIRAFIVGDGETRTIIEKLAYKYNLNISSNGTNKIKPDISFLGWVKNVDIVYAGADIVALTSLNEGTPVSLLEAQAAGKPIVATNVGGIKDIVANEQQFFLSNPHDEDAFIDNLISSVQNINLLKNSNNDSINTVLKNFHFERLVNDMKKLYDEVLKNKNIDVTKKEFA